MKTKQLKYLLWIALCTLIVIGASSIEQTALALPEQAQQDVIPVAFVFDLNGVLFDTNSIAFFRQLGVQDTLWYLARHRSPQLLKNRFFQTLHRITASETDMHDLKDPDGAYLPLLMAHWLMGTQSNTQLQQTTIQEIAAHPEWFASVTEQRLIGRMACAIFDPAKFVASRKLLPDLIPLMRALKKKGIKLYALSNWDRESFALLQEKYSDIFALFDETIISGNVGHAKPHAPIYAHLKNKIPHHTICFLDDQHENLMGAETAGLHTIHVGRKKGYLRSSIDLDAIIAQTKQFLKKQYHLAPAAIGKPASTLNKERNKGHQHK